jgi:hypothetical protein
MLVTPRTAALYPEQSHVGTPEGPLLMDDQRLAYVLDRVRRAAVFLRWSLE